VAVNWAREDVAVDAVRDGGVVVHSLSWHRMTPGDAGLVLGYAANAPDRLRLGRVSR
jgi:GntR family transcriptional regulator/MocR family aminotransferase